MKQLLLICLLITYTVNSQDFSLVDTKVKTYPKLISSEKLAQNIKTDFSSDITKVRAVFTWIAQNIRYDLQEFLNPKQTSIRFSYSSEEEKNRKLKAIKEGIVSSTLSKRKAVCEGYAQTFSKVCDLLGIENEVIKGFVRNSPKEIGKPKLYSNHAWNAVKINNQWLYFDTTWAAGYLMNGKWQRNFNDYYFNIP
ncbi:MAG: transglutaminase domain-containing protein, partial [Flavobacteriaceae bacterium]